MIELPEDVRRAADHAHEVLPNWVAWAAVTTMIHHVTEATAHDIAREILAMPLPDADAPERPS